MEKIWLDAAAAYPKLLDSVTSIDRLEVKILITNILKIFPDEIRTPFDPILVTLGNVKYIFNTLESVMDHYDTVISKDLENWSAFTCS